MAYLITGERGFIGSVLKKKLEESGVEVVGTSAENIDITQVDCFKKINKKITHVFHLAANVSVPDSWVSPVNFYQTNFLGLLNVLDFCAKHSAKLTFISSYLYGRVTQLPISEDFPTEAMNPYAHSKLLGEHLCDFYAKNFHVDIVVIRPFNIFGTGQSDKFLIPHIVNQALYADEIKVMDLLPRRDYLYVDDLVDALVCTLNSKSSLATYNIGYGTSWSVAEIIDIVQEIAGTNKPVISSKEVRINEINDVVADIQRAKNELGWEPKISFEAGIEKLIQFSMQSSKDS